MAKAGRSNRTDTATTRRKVEPASPPTWIKPQLAATPKSRGSNALCSLWGVLARFVLRPCYGRCLATPPWWEHVPPA